MINAEKILLKSLVTEKTTAASANANQYTFRVATDANKISVAQAIEIAFPEAKVAKVSIMNVRPKAKRDRMRRGKVGYKAGYKKAIVTLKPGTSIEMV